VSEPARERFAESDLRQFAESVLSRLGSPRAEAALVADNLIDADRRGVHTHGLVRLPSYCAQVDSGEVVLGVVPRIVPDTGAVGMVDGQRGFGAVIGSFAVDQAIRRASFHGVALVTARDANHFGTAAYYARRAADQGLVGVAATNTAAVLAPTGGAAPRLGNNPFAIAAPMPGGRPPFVLDMAQSAVARGRIKLAEMNGIAIPPDWALGPDGTPTTDPAAALAGALLPFGGYKGYGLALAVELLAGVLSGASLSPELVNTGMTGRSSNASGTLPNSAVGNAYLVVDPAMFVGREEYAARMGGFADAIKATPPAPGVDEVLLPGELEARSEAEADRLGVELDPSAIAGLAGLGREYGIAPPAALTEAHNRIDAVV
jgi:LDH2 family malate/lactate/ureidoglycolate dehydrogenase